MGSTVREGFLFHPERIGFVDELRVKSIEWGASARKCIWRGGGKIQFLSRFHRLVFGEAGEVGGIPGIRRLSFERSTNQVRGKNIRKGSRQMNSEQEELYGGANEGSQFLAGTNTTKSECAAPDHRTTEQLQR